MIVMIVLAIGDISWTSIFLEILLDRLDMQNLTQTEGAITNQNK